MDRVLKMKRGTALLCAVISISLGGASCLRPLPENDLDVVITAASDVVFTGVAAGLNAIATKGTTPYLYRWSMEAAPDGVVDLITDPTARSITTDPFPAAGEYSFRVVVTDAAEFRAISFIHLTVRDPIPGEVFSVSISVPATLVLDEDIVARADTAFSQFDRDEFGDLQFAWTLVSGEADLTNPSEQNVTVRPLAVGDIVLRVVMTNPETGETTFDERTLRVVGEGALRVTIDGQSVIEVDQATEYTAVVINAEGTLSYEWKVISGPGAVETLDLNREGEGTIFFTSPQVGESVIEVVVTDDDTGLEARAEMAVSVVPRGELVITMDVGPPQLGSPNQRRTVSAEVEGIFDELTYLWTVEDSFGTELTDPTAAEPVIVLPPEGTAHLRLIVEATTVGGRTEQVQDELFIAVIDGPNPVIEFFFDGFGLVKVQLDSEGTPISTANFLSYVDEGFYDGLTIHRVETGEVEGSIGVVQGGAYLPEAWDDDDLTNDDPKTPHENIPNEGAAERSNVRGTISMARAQFPETANAQFFINTQNNGRTADSAGLDYEREGVPGFAVFGNVIEGMEFIDEMLLVDRSFDTNFNFNIPDEPIVIRFVRREQ